MVTVPVISGRIEVEFMKPILPESMDYETIVTTAREMIRSRVCGI